MKQIIDAYKQMQMPKKIEESTLRQHHKDFVDRRVEDYGDTISDDTHDKIHAALGDNQFVHFPVAESGAYDADPDVVEHLANHGYDVHDYKAGIAVKKAMVGNPAKGIPMQEKVVKQSIGSVLAKTKAPEDVVKAFVNDPSRTATKQRSGHHVVITRTPYAVAGMSTGTSWTSCMNLDNGGYHHHINDDLRTGTHVAYLVNHDDETAFKYGEPSKPIARIALKPFHADGGDNTDEDTIFRPEGKEYGSASNDFTNAVHKWATEKYPAKEGVTYHKNHNVYSDDNTDEYNSIHTKDVTDAIDRGHPFVDNNGQSIDHHIIDSAIKHLKDKAIPNGVNAKIAIAHFSSIGNLTTKHLVDLSNISKANSDADTHRGNLHNMSFNHGQKFSSSMINETIDGMEPSRIPRNIIASPKFPDHLIDKIPNDKLVNVRRSKIKEHHVDKVVDALVNNESSSLYNARELSWAMKPHHIDKLVNAGSTSHGFVAAHPQLSKESHDKLVAMGNTDVFAHSKHAAYDQIKDPHVKNKAVQNLAKNPHLTDGDAKKIALGIENASLGANPVHIPAKIGEHIDYDNLAKNRYVNSPSFENPEHSHKHMDALRKVAMDEETKVENGDMDEADRWDSMTRYEDAVEKHIDHHVGHDDAINHEEVERMHDRLQDDYHDNFRDDGGNLYNHRRKMEDYYHEGQGH